MVLAMPRINNCKCNVLFTRYRVEDEIIIGFVQGSRLQKVFSFVYSRTVNLKVIGVQLLNDEMSVCTHNDSYIKTASCFNCSSVHSNHINIQLAVYFTVSMAV